MSSGSIAGVTLTTSTAMNVSENCSMLLVHRNIYKRSGSTYNLIDTTGLSWTAIENSLTLLLMSDSTIKRLNPSTNVFYTIYTSATAFPSGSLIFSNEASGYKKMVVIHMTQTSVWFQFFY